MKRKKVPTTSKPAWGIVPIEEWFAAVQFWEVSSEARMRIKENPIAAEEFKRQEELRPQKEKAHMERLYQIAPQVRQTVKDWAETGSFPNIWIPEEGQTSSAPLAVLTLWETRKAVCSLFPNRAGEFMSLLPQEARLLLLRLEKHLIRSAANNPQTTNQNEL